MYVCEYITIYCRETINVELIKSVSLENNAEQSGMTRVISVPLMRPVKKKLLMKRDNCKELNSWGINRLHRLQMRR